MLEIVGLLVATNVVPTPRGPALVSPMSLGVGLGETAGLAVEVEVATGVGEETGVADEVGEGVGESTGLGVDGLTSEALGGAISVADTGPETAS